jgi:hypothetical protein
MGRSLQPPSHEHEEQEQEQEQQRKLMFAATRRGRASSLERRQLLRKHAWVHCV